MKVLITGTSGRIGRAIYIHLMKHYEVIGIDKTPSSTADFIGDIRDYSLLNKALQNVDVIIHTAALHAPHVGLVSDNEFEDINVTATRQLALLGREHKIKHFLFTSTTALYGFASIPDGIAGWVDETIKPQPKTIYHRTKIMAEQTLESISIQYKLPVTVLQMSRCFPEPADQMAVYRLSRGVDARDVASAHACALIKRPPGFQRFIISSATPFAKNDCKDLYYHADRIIAAKASKLAKEFIERGWNIPNTMDRVYDSSKAQKELGWSPRYGYESVMLMLDEESSEVLPVVPKLC